MPTSPVPLEISVQEAKRLADTDPNVELIDVREPDERARCAIQGSRHIPLRQIPEQLASLPKNRHLLIYCHHGGRSLRATQFLRANGLSQVTNVAGGIDAWAEQIEPGMARY